jgi:hypothetical protein
MSQRRAANQRPLGVRRSTRTLILIIENAGKALLHEPGQNFMCIKMQCEL